ncbi:hypothetical protein ABNF65_12660 [Paenibacillus larvae]
MSEQQPRKLRRCVIKEEFVSLTGDAVSAAILNQMIFWAELVNESDQEILNKIKAYEKIGDRLNVANLKKQLKNGWFWKAAKEMAEEIMFSTRQTVDRKMRALVKKGFMECRPNPDPRYVTNYYRVNLGYIQSELHKLGFSLEGYALYEPQNKPEKNTICSIAQDDQYQIWGIAQDEQGVAQDEQGVAQDEQVSNYQSLDVQSLDFEEEDVYTGNDPLIHILINTSGSKSVTIRHEAFLQNLTKYKIQDEFAIQVVEYMASRNQDINNYSCDAIDKTFSEFVKRYDKIKVFPRWFATTIKNKQFEVDQDYARQDEQRREEERFQRRLERYKDIGNKLVAATSDME